MADALRIHAPDPTPAPTPPEDALNELLALLRERLAPADGLLDRDEFARLLAIGTSTLDRMRAAGRIGPRPVKLGGTAVRYERREVVAWIAARDPAGRLFDAKSWPPVWADLLRRRAAAR